MELSGIASTLTEFLFMIGNAPIDQVTLVVTFLVMSTALVASCVPGVIIPLSLCSGALLGPWTATLVMVAGTVVGSQLLFLSTRHLLQSRARPIVERRLGQFDRHFGRHGVSYVVGLRLVGVPHFLVTAASALAPLRAGTFAVATAIGFLPAVALAATAGSQL